MAKHNNNKKEKILVKTLVDIDTGEMLEIYEGDRFIKAECYEIIRGKQFDRKLTKVMKEWNKNLGGFIFILFQQNDKILNIKEKLTTEKFLKLIYLATYINYDGVLIYKQSPMTKHDMEELMNINRINLNLFLNQMFDLGIMSENAEGRTMISQDYFVKGDLDPKLKKNNNFSRIFINPTRYLFENVPKDRHSKLGAFYKMIPYVHRQWNILCYSPDDMRTDVKAMPFNEIYKILYCHKNTLIDFVEVLNCIRLDNGEGIIALYNSNIYDSNKHKYIMVNPKIYYGGNFNVEGGQEAILKYFK